MMKTITKIKNSKALVTLVWVLGLLVIWEIFAFIIQATKRTPENIMPHVWQIFYSLIDPKPVSNGMSCLQVVLFNAGQTLSRAGQGFMIGTLIGFALAILMKLSHVVEKIAAPYLMLIQLIPILGMAPIILAMTHDIGSSRIIIAAILTFYPVATNTLAGLNSVEKQKYELMYSYAAKKSTVYFKMLIPSCIPYFFSSMSGAAPMAITASILVDTLQGDGGLGCMLSQSLKHAMSIYVFWDIVVFSAVIGVLSCSLMGWIENAVSPLKRIERKTKKKKEAA